MGRDVFEASAGARATFEAADEALGFSLSKICFEGPDDELRRTEIQQPAILTTSVALLRALEEQTEVRADFVAGHSLGEYTALVAAGGLPFEEAVRLVHQRGRFMQEAVPEGHGAMAAVMGAGPEVVVEACAAVSRELGEIVAPANFNSPQQTVIAGTTTAVARACEEAKNLGAKRTVALAVSAPFHCSLMEPAASRLEAELASAHFSDLNVPLVSNVEAKMNRDAASIPGLLRSQVTEPVRFSEMVTELSAQGVDRFLEVGPGRVLSGLVARIQRRSARANVASLEDIDEAKKFLAEAV